MERVGFLDVVSLAAQRNTCIVLPTLEHAIQLWPRYVDFIRPRFKSVITAKTIVYLLDTHTVFALWVPYEREPTMSMDHATKREGFYFVSPYGGM